MKRTPSIQKEKMLRFHLRILLLWGVKNISALPFHARRDKLKRGKWNLETWWLSKKQINSWETGKFKEKMNVTKIRQRKEELQSQQTPATTATNTKHACTQKEREPENARLKAEADKDQRHLEMTIESSRPSGSVADEIEDVGSWGNRERTEGWAKSVAQQSGLNLPLSPDCIIDPPNNVKQDIGDKHFSAYPNTTPLFPLDIRLCLSAIDWTELSQDTRSPKINYSNGHVCATNKPIFHQHGISAF